MYDFEKVVFKREIKDRKTYIAKTQQFGGPSEILSRRLRNTEILLRILRNTEILAYQVKTYLDYRKL